MPKKIIRRPNATGPRPETKHRKHRKTVYKSPEIFERLHPGREFNLQSTMQSIIYHND